jgi:hypothetical protein
MSTEGHSFGGQRTEGGGQRAEKVEPRFDFRLGLSSVLCLPSSDIGPCRGRTALHRAAAIASDCFKAGVGG